MKNIKTRHWAFVVYPESLPDNWLDYIVSTGIQACISPLHDKDFNPTGEPKKPHYHVIISYSGPTTYKNVCNIFTEPLRATIPQPLQSINGYYRYLTHKDNPEKFQYNDLEIVTLNGFDIKDFAELTYSEVMSISKYVTSFIVDNHIIEYCDLVDCFNKPDTENIYDVIFHNTYFFSNYIKSYRNKSYDKERR